MSEGTIETPVQAGRIPREVLHPSKGSPNYALLLVQQRTGYDSAVAVSEGKNINDVERELLDKALEFQTNPAANDMKDVLFAKYSDSLAVRSVNDERLSGNTGTEIDRRAYLTYTSLQAKFRKERLHNQ